MNFISLIYVFSQLFGLISLGKCNSDFLTVVKNDFESHLLLATVSGNLYLFHKYTGEQIWRTKMDNFVKTQNTNGSMLVPNPISGQLFIFQHHSNNKDLFTQMEHSVYEYVRQTPVFIENMLLTGSKNDHWLSINIDTGEIVNRYRTGSSDNCPGYDPDKDSNHTLYIGVCEYNLVISDPSTRHIIYNVVMNSLATHAITDLEHFGLQLYASSDSGLVVAKYTSDGSEKSWSCVVDSSVIGFYATTRQGVLSRLHFTTMSHETIDQFLRPGAFIRNKLIFKKSLFFGHNNNNWYVLKAYISEDTTIKSVTRVNVPLITGPTNVSYHGQYSAAEGPSSGFYEVPPDSYPEMQDKMVNSRYLLDFDKKYYNNALVPKDFKRIIIDNLPKGDYQDSWPILLVGTLVAATFVMTVFILCHLRRQNNKVYQDPVMSICDSTDPRATNDDESIVIGDISYNPSEVLGYGSNGTAVFRGVFHGNSRSVAVKRLIKSEQSHYELQFLRQSFDCNFLIKCFYMTHSREFTFLALELCECTLEGYVTDLLFRETCGLNKSTVCKQMISGVHFLHDKGIVHRDLKPRNVLLMKQHKVVIRPEAANESKPYQYKIVISDFGLSRQSLDHCLSITKTGCGGTSGYMAPELSREDVKRITTSADIFSCAILFYYITTDGQHPFGAEVLSRQHRIHQGQFSLNEELFSDQLLLYFIKCMLHQNPVERPAADEILDGPLFWKSLEKLSFICDLSDFVEKADISLILSLDKLGSCVFDDKWTDEMEPELVETLTCQRSYKTRLLSHLIRAMRNKRNHFHDLPSHLSESLFACSLDGLADYIDRKFPHLYCVLYEWVRLHLAHLSDSLQHYFPSHLSKRPLATASRLSQPANTDMSDKEGNSGDGFLEWRKPSRKRPTQAKKQRGSRHSNKAET